VVHSVSHKLILQLNGSELIVVTIKKNGLVDEISRFLAIDENGLETVLNQLPDIYSETTLLVCNNNFVTIPEIFYDESIDDIFKLNYEISINDKVCFDKLEYGIGVGYTLNSNFDKLVSHKFPRIIIKHEASIVLKKLYKEVNFKHSKILISINEQTLIIYAIHHSNILLCNKYEILTIDDIFYFVMLAMEQLQILPAESELIILGEPPNREEIFEIFKNYIKEINIWLEEYQIENINNSELLSHFFALQTLVCE